MPGVPSHQQTTNSSPVAMAMSMLLSPNLNEKK